MKDRSSQDTAPQALKVRLSWREYSEQTPRVHADEVAVSYVGERVYLTFGEVIPLQPGAVTSVASGIQIEPVAQVVLTQTGLAKFRELLVRIAAELPTVSSEGEQ